MGDKLKIGIVGVGARGMRHLKMLSIREDVVFVAVADTDSRRQSLVEEVLGYSPNFYTHGEDSYKEMMTTETLDAVLIYTPWHCHLSQSVFAMEQGIPVGLEVGTSFSISDCWAFVEAYERTKTPIMLLENCCYRRDIMAVQRLVEAGVLGELVHLRGGYRHDIRFVLLDENGNFGEGTNGESVWRTPLYLKHNADIYPTHGLGPLAQMLKINRGNRLVSVSAMSSKSLGINDYSGKQYPVMLGDIITTQIKCENGETILLTHDTTLPRPFGLEFQVQGTKGIWQDFYRGGEEDSYIYVDDNEFVTDKQWSRAKDILAKYDAPIWKKLGEKTKEFGRYDIDFVMFDDFIECVKHQKPFPIDVYDLAVWRSITPLSEKSIRENSLAQEVPDFKKGK